MDNGNLVKDPEEVKAFINKGVNHGYEEEDN